MSTWLVAIDDTDDETSIGTGRLARQLASALEAAGRLRETSVTRHQLLVHPDIPYTSHNSAACIAGRGGPSDGEKLADLARSFLLESFRPRANPGLCVCRADVVPAPLVTLARRAQREVLALDAFDRQVAALDLVLWSGGETGQGRIGAASGVALRSTGEDGRFIALRGIRDVGGTLRVSELIERCGVDAVETPDGAPLAPDVEIDTRDWVRPTLRGGRPVLVVRREDGRWLPAERRSKDD